jgi:hypothetical protein
MKKKLLRGLQYVALGFVVLFLLRLGYGYAYPGYRAVRQDEAGWFETALRNYASEKLVMKGKSDAPAYSVDQKYEKVASVQSRTRAFDEDEKKIRNLTAQFAALIQFEQSYGLPGARRLNLAIGVPPAKFDEMVQGVRNIGQLASVRIDKSDKTNEYKELNAKRVSLEKTRDELTKLKTVGGNIEERINLENRLLEIERDIQGTGVKLGEYDQENEFCTIKFGLTEAGNAQAGIPLLTRSKIALEWTIKYYAVLLASLVLAVILVWLVVLLLERFKLIAAAFEAAQRAGSAAP